MTKFSRFTLLSLAIVGLLIPSFGFAQTSSTQGAIIGTVTDTSGGVLPGVTVTVTSPQLQGSRTATTDAKGDFVLPLLPPGVYKADFTLSGLKTVSQTGIVVNVGQNTKQDAKLALGAVTESMTVTASSIVVDPTETTTQQNFKEDHLKYATIGQAGRSYQTVLGQAPGAAGGSNPQVMGSNLGQNQWRMDGLNTTDPVTHTFSTNFVFDAIQEISLQTAGYEAEYGKGTGGIVNVITKSGGNNFSGSVDARLSNQHMQQQGHKHQEAPDPTALANDNRLQVFKNWGPQATIGGPIQRDKIWFFVSGQHLHNHNQPPNTRGFQPGDRQFIGYNTFGKLTTTLTPNQTFALKYTYNPALIPFAQQSSTVRPEADRDQYQSTRIWNGSYDMILSSQWLANVQAGLQRSFLRSAPHSGDLLTTGTIDRSSGISSVNYTNFQAGNRNRDELLASTSYFLNAGGTHQLKIGTDLDRTTFTSTNFTTGTPLDPAMCSPSFRGVALPIPAGSVCGAINRPINGANSLYDVSTIIPEQEFKAHARTFYGQDEWRPVEKLTVKLGLRYDAQTFKNDDGSTQVTLSKYQPRIGFAYDLFNNANTVVHGHWGRFMDDNALTLASYLASDSAITVRYSWSNAQQRFNPAQAFGGPAGNLLDPTLKPTYANETNFGITQRLSANSSVDLTGIWKKSNDIFEDSCAFDNCNTDGTFWMTNRPNGMDVLKQKYTGAILKYELRPSWGNILATYTWAKSLGSVEYTQNAGADFDVFPINFVNRYGYLSDDARHRIKVDGYAKGPWGTILGANWYWDSGVPFNVTRNSAISGTEFLEPRGDRRLPHFKQLDLQLQKNFTVANTTLGLIGSVFNVFNKETVTARRGSVGNEPATVANPSPTAFFNTASAWQRPRRYEVGFRIEY